MTADGLRKHLEAAGISRRELARMLDYDQRTIRRYCAGYPIPRAVEYAVRWLFDDWPAHVPPQEELYARRTP